jgi:hypothetical protein
MAQAVSRRHLTAENWEIRFQCGKKERKKERKEERKKERKEERKKERKKVRQTESPSNLVPNLQKDCEYSGFLTDSEAVQSQGNF